MGRKLAFELMEERDNLPEKSNPIKKSTISFDAMMSCRQLSEFVSEETNKQGKV